MSRLLVILGFGLLTGGPALASVLPEDLVSRLATEAEAFVQTKGYVLVDTDTLTDNRYYSAAVFPGINPNAMFAPDADLDAVTKALLLLDSRETALPRVRYRVSYNTGFLPEAPEVQQSYVEVTRINMGPAVRADLQNYVDPEHLAGPESFGVGPHVSWRFAMAPRMGMVADIVSASRKELSEAEATALNCLGISCGTLHDPEGPDGTWMQPDVPGLGQPTYLSDHQGLARPARVAQELLTVATPDGLEAIPYRPEKPRMVFVISQNVSGQEEIVHGLLQDVAIMDDAVAEVWTQRLQISGMPADFSQLYVGRKRQP